jgi:hypothetical protein
VPSWQNGKLTKCHVDQTTWRLVSLLTVNVMQHLGKKSKNNFTHSRVNPFGTEREIERERERERGREKDKSCTRLPDSQPSKNGKNSGSKNGILTSW